MDSKYIVNTDDGAKVLYSPVYGESYRSVEGAFTESKMLFLESSGLLHQLQQGTIQDTLSILDVGLGLGYNALTLINAWFDEKSPPNIDLVSLEMDAYLLENLVSGTAIWQDSWPETWKLWIRYLKVHTLDNQYHAIFTHPHSGAVIDWDVFRCDASKFLTDKAILTEYLKTFDFVLYDPFSPKKNPELWTEFVFEGTRTIIKPSGTLATYSVARQVREAFIKTGWRIQKIEGAIGKRHWLLCFPNLPLDTSTSS